MACWCIVADHHMVVMIAFISLLVLFLQVPPMSAATAGFDNLIISKVVFCYGICSFQLVELTTCKSIADLTMYAFITYNGNNMPEPLFQFPATDVNGKPTTNIPSGSRIFISDHPEIIAGSPLAFDYLFQSIDVFPDKSFDGSLIGNDFMLAFNNLLFDRFDIDGGNRYGAFLRNSRSTTAAVFDFTTWTDPGEDLLALFQEYQCAVGKATRAPTLKPTNPHRKPVARLAPTNPPTMVPVPLPTPEPTSAPTKSTPRPTMKVTLAKRKPTNKRI